MLLIQLLVAKNEMPKSHLVPFGSLESVEKCRHLHRRAISSQPMHG